jgi:hypothetical protein
VAWSIPGDWKRAVSAVADKLREARALIERGWTQGAYARNAAGEDLEDVDWEFSDTDPVCWCMSGAMMQAGLEDEADDFIQRAIGKKFIPEWNDASERTQAEVLAAFDRAIELAEAGQASPGGDAR